MNSEPRIEQRGAHPYAAIRMQVPIPFGKYLQPAWSRVEVWLAARHKTHGPAIIRYLTTDMSTTLDIDVGFIIRRAIPGGDGILTGTLPAGRYATLTYTGSYRGKCVYRANVALIGWAETNGVVWKTSQVDGAEWWDSRVEWYLNDPKTDPHPEKYKTELTFKVASAARRKRSG